MTVAGHELRMTTANSWARIPTCTCGWIGVAHHPPRLWERTNGERRKTPKLDHEHANVEARNEWYEHCALMDVHRAIGVNVAKPIVADLAFRGRHHSFE